jgi:hypothetical protein
MHSLLVVMVPFASYAFERFEVIFVDWWMWTVDRQQTGDSPGKKPLPPPNAVLHADAAAYGHPPPSSYGSTTRSVNFGRQSSHVPDYNKPPQSYPQRGYAPTHLEPQYGSWAPPGYPSSGPGSPPTAPEFGDETQTARGAADGQVCWNLLSVSVL